MSVAVSRDRTVGLGKIGRDRATRIGEPSGGRSVWRGDRTIRLGRVSGDWPTLATWDRTGGNGGVGNWSLTADADESCARLSGNDGWDLRVRSISGSWTVRDRTAGLGESSGRWAARLWEPGRDLAVWRGEIGGGRTRGNSGIRVDWDVTTSWVGVGVGSVRFIVGNWNIWDRAGGLWESGWWWATGLWEPTGDRSVWRREVSGGRAGGDSSIRVDWNITASGIWVGAVRFIMRNRNIWDRTGGLGKPGWWWAAGLGEPTGDRSVWRGEVGGERTRGDGRLRRGCVITATVARIGVVRFIRDIWDRATGLGESSWGWATGIGEPRGGRSIWRWDRPIRPGHIGGKWPTRNSHSSWDRSIGNWTGGNTLVWDGRNSH